MTDKIVDFEHRRARREIERLLIELRTSGLFVVVEEDYSDALVVWAHDGEGHGQRLWIDPLGKHARRA